MKACGAYRFAHGTRVDPEKKEIERRAIPTIAERPDESASREDREWLRITLDSIGDAVISADANGNVTFLNPVGQALTGWTQDEAHGVSLTRVFTIVNEESRQLVDSPTVRALREGVVVRLANHTLLVARDGTERAIDNTAAPIRNAAGLVVGVVLVFRDVTERRRAEEILRSEEAASRKSEVQYRRLFESARDGILILDEKTGKISDANPYMSELLGYDLAHFLGKQLWEIGLFKDIAANQAAFRELQLKGYIRYDHLPLETRDKRTVDVEFVSNTYEADGRLVIQCNIRDCSERFRLEQAIRASLEEKKVLLQEVHHRVKNNLQVISSLLHLQSQHTDDPASVRMFRQSQDRVRSMAMVHERLYRSKDLAHVDFTDYIESLATHLFTTYQVNTERIRLEVAVHEGKLPIDAAIPCGLLLNELISNCLKHAFPGQARGEIRVELLRLSGGAIRLSVSDDGVGMPPNVEPKTAASFGMQLIADLADQLHGSVQIIRNAGTSIRIVFPSGDRSPVQRQDHL